MRRPGERLATFMSRPEAIDETHDVMTNDGQPGQGSLCVTAATGDGFNERDKVTIVCFHLRLF
jgi:hypothetical protein